MKKYDVQIKVVKEHAEAISKIEELVAGSEIKNLDIPNFTKHYTIIDIVKKPLFKKKHHRWFVFFLKWW